MKNTIYFIFLILVFVSCGPKVIFEEKAEINNGVWTKDQKLSYSFEVTDTIKKYDILLNVNSNKEYKYQNIYINIETIFPKGNKTEDLVSLEISKPNGEPFGKCSGDECTTPILLQEKVKFPSLGKYIINMYQYSRLQSIEGLNSGILLIQEAEQ
jgi:gliding motility-associated lipoprotein GldH